MDQTVSTPTPLPSPPGSRRWLFVAVACHFVLGGVYLAVLPLWGAVPDEPIHYSTIKHNAEFGRQATVTNPRPWGEPLSVYCFTADPVGAATHGPLYYWASVPIFWLSRGLTVEAQLYVLRAWTLLVSAIMIPLAWLVLGRIFSDAPGLRDAGVMIVALMPHRLMLSAVVYNDIGCAAATFVYLWLLQKAAGDRGTPRLWFWAGVALGLAFLGKRVALVTIPGSLLVLALQHRRLGWSWRLTGQCLAAWVGGALLSAGWWVWRDLRLYGMLFPTEPGFHEQSSSVLVQWFALPPELFWWRIQTAMLGLWKSVWSQVGWIPLPGDRHAPGGWRLLSAVLYGGFAAGSVLAVAGFFGGWRSRWRGLTPEARDLLAGYLALAAGMLAGALHWVLTFSFHNHEETGKHAQAILIALVALFLAGCRWAAGGRWAVRAGWLAALFLIVFNLASLVRLTTYWIPTTAPPVPKLGQRAVRDLPSGRAPGIWHRYRVPGVTQEGGVVPRPTSREEAWHGDW